MRRDHDPDDEFGIPLDDPRVPVTRIEVLDFVGEAFDDDRPTRSALVTHAAAEGARPALLELLATLPDGRFDDPDALWAALPGVPVDLRDGRPGSRAGPADG